MRSRSFLHRLAWNPWLVGSGGLSLLALGCGGGGGDPDEACSNCNSATGGDVAAGGRAMVSGGSAGQTRGGASSLGTGGSSAGRSAGGSGTGASTGGVSAPTTGGAASSEGGRGGVGGGGASSGGTSGGVSGGNASNTGGTSKGGANAGGSAGSPSSCGATGFHVRDGVLYDVNCNEFVMRGVNYPYAWFSSRNVEQDLNAIAATGANAVRLVLATGGRWTKTDANALTSLINWSKAAKLVPILEVHDTTGYREQSGSVPLSDATSYWTGSDIVTVLEGQEAFVIVNIGNEPNGNDTSDIWASSHVTAVQALRNAGLAHTLMIDAPNWGQDWENTMRDGAGDSIWQADADKNLVFSVHMYDVYGTSSTVSNYFNTFSMNYQAPLVVGEFAADHGASKDVDEDTIMSLAENLSIGYLGWSWSGNGEGLGSLDITNNFDAGSLTTWGARLINGMNGIEMTSAPCTCFE